MIPVVGQFMMSTTDWFSAPPVLAWYEVNSLGTLFGNTSKVFQSYQKSEHVQTPNLLQNISYPSPACRTDCALSIHDAAIEDFDVLVHVGANRVPCACVTFLSHRMTSCVHYLKVNEGTVLIQYSQNKTHLFWKIKMMMIIITCCQQLMSYAPSNKHKR